MANGQQLSLEIVIKTIADARGIATTQQEIKALADEMRGATTAGKPLEVNADAIAQSLQRTKQAATQASGEFKGFTDEQKRQAQEALRNIEANERAAKAANTLGRDVRSATSALGGLRTVISGALTGNLLLVAQGFGQISASIATATKGMQLFFGQLARGGAIGAVFAAPVLVGIAALKSAASDAEATMKRWWDEAAAGATRYRQRSAEVTAAVEKDFEQLRSSVQSLAGELDRLFAVFDRADRRVSTLTAAQKELALAQAKTPEERAAIEAGFAARELENNATNADLRSRAAEDIQTNARQQLRDADAKVREAEAELAGAEDTVRSYGTRTSPASIEAVAEMKAMRDKVKAAKSARDQLQQELSPIFERTQEQIDEARLTREVTGIRQQTLSVTTAKSTATSNVDTKERLGELSRIATDAMLRGDYRTQDLAVAETNKLKAAMGQFTKAVVDSNATNVQTLDAATKDVQKQKQQAKNLKESRAGG